MWTHSNHDKLHTSYLLLSTIFEYFQSDPIESVDSYVSDTLLTHPSRFLKTQINK